MISYTKIKHCKGDNIPQVHFNYYDGSFYYPLPGRLVKALGYQAGDRLRITSNNVGVSVKKDEGCKSATVLRYRSNAKSFFHVIPKEIANFLDVEDKKWFKLLYYTEEKGLVFSCTNEPFNRLEDRKQTLKITKEVIADSYRKRQADLYRKQVDLYEKMSGKH